jgi:hypothetical protein
VPPAQPHFLVNVFLAMRIDHWTRGIGPAEFVYSLNQFARIIDEMIGQSTLNYNFAGKFDNLTLTHKMPIP